MSADPPILFAIAGCNYSPAWGMALANTQVLQQGYDPIARRACQTAGCRPAADLVRHFDEISHLRGGQVTDFASTGRSAKPQHSSLTALSAGVERTGVDHRAIGTVLPVQVLRAIARLGTPPISVSLTVRRAEHVFPPSGTSVKLQRTMPSRSSRNWPTSWPWPAPASAGPPRSSRNRPSCSGSRPPRADRPGTEARLEHPRACSAPSLSKPCTAMPSRFP